MACLFVSAMSVSRRKIGFSSKFVRFQLLNASNFCFRSMQYVSYPYVSLGQLVVRSLAQQLPCRSGDVQESDGTS